MLDLPIMDIEVNIKINQSERGISEDIRHAVSAMRCKAITVCATAGCPYASSHHSVVFSHVVSRLADALPFELMRAC